jgi:hypothetical protein
MRDAMRGLTAELFVERQMHRTRVGMVDRVCCASRRRACLYGNYVFALTRDNTYLAVSPSQILFSGC